MKRNPLIRTTIFSMVILLCINLISVSPVNGNSGLKDTETIGQVAIPNRGIITIKNLQLFQESDGSVIAFTVELSNTGTRELDFIDYWVKVKTAAGAEYNPVLVDREQNGRIPAKTTKTFEMYSSVDKNTSLNGLAFEVIEWDFNVYPDYKKVLGTIKVPASYSPVTMAGKIKQLEILGTFVDTKIVGFDVIQDEQSHHVTIQYEMKNVGQKGITLPDYIYYIRSQEGYLYPMTANVSQKISLQPKQTQMLELTAEIPREIVLNRWTFILVKKAGEHELSAASYELPKPSIGKEQTGDTYVYKNKNGSYEISLKSVQRLPWEDLDILAAEFEVANGHETKSLPLLKLEAEFLLDGVSVNEGTTEFVTLDNVIGLNPRTSMRIIVLTKIPYTYEFSKIEVALYDKETTNRTKISQFPYEKALNVLRVIDEGMNYRLTDIGRRATIQVRNAQTYEGLNSNIIYTELDIVNNEKRMTELTRLHAYFQTVDGVSFPASVSKITEKVAPSGHVLLAIWSEVPKSFMIDQFDLILGQGITNGKLSTGNDESTSYVNAVILKIADEVKEIDTDLRDMNIYPYTFSLRKINLLAVDQTKFRLEFAYDVSKSAYYEAIPENHSILIEIINGNNKYTKEVHFEEGTEFLEIGQGLRKTLFFDDPELFNNNKFQTYMLNVYDQFKGHKKLLATKELRWYFESE